MHKDWSPMSRPTPCWVACAYGRTERHATERHDMSVDGHKPPVKVTNPSGSVLQLRAALAVRRTEEDRAVRSASTPAICSSVRRADCRQLPLIYIRVDSGTGLVADWSVTCPTRLIYL